MSNTAMHLSRHRIAIFFAEHTLRPGDDERYAALAKATSGQNNLAKISPIQPGLCGLDGLLYNSSMDRLGRSS